MWNTFWNNPYNPINCTYAIIPNATGKFSPGSTYNEKRLAATITASIRNEFYLSGRPLCERCLEIIFRRFQGIKCLSMSLGIISGPEHLFHWIFGTKCQVYVFVYSYTWKFEQNPFRNISCVDISYWEFIKNINKLAET